MKKIEAIIFDMDGTLYSFDDANESHFQSSDFGKAIQGNCLRFFQTQFGVDETEAQNMYSDFTTRYNGEVSLGLEREHGIDRSIYFSATWDLQPEKFMKSNEALVQSLGLVSIQTGILTAAPRVWADRVLEFLSIKQFFDPAIFTGDPNIRKPDPQAFQQLAEFWQLDPTQIISVGDQERTDILPAKSIGMTTVRIGREAETQADFQATNAIQAIALLKQKGII